MRNLLRRFLASMLVVLLVFCIVGCTKADRNLLNEKVTAMIDLIIKHDTEAMYSMLYPGAMDVETYLSTAELIDDYFPVTVGYTWNLQQLNVRKGVNEPYKIYDGQYKVEFDEKVFYIVATWRSDSDGEGFMRFQILNEEDWVAAQKS